MASHDPSLPSSPGKTVVASKITWSLSASDMSASPVVVLSDRWVDDEDYNTRVLCLPSNGSEDKLDQDVAREAENLGLCPRQPTPSVDTITSSLSTITVASDSIHQGSIQSQSTAPTSCASSDYRPPTQSSHNEQPFDQPECSSKQPESEKKSASPFRRGFRKMAGFRKKRSSLLTPASLTSISSDADVVSGDHVSIKSDPKTSVSIESSKSSWSQPVAIPQEVDEAALKRSAECEEMVKVRSAQLDERRRFLEFQNHLLNQLRAERDSHKARMREMQKRVIEGQQIKNDKAIEDMEGRQLEEESKMRNEQEAEKRAVVTRLKHMEAYCRNPTPPPTPVDPTSGRPSVDSAFPERKVTERDYNNLAQQYRERESMNTLHQSKLNVLRGRQEKALENLSRKKAREVEAIEAEHTKELNEVDADYAGKESELRLALDTRRARLESRWRTQALIERTKMEKATGLKYTPLPDVVALEEYETTTMTTIVVGA